MENPYSSPLTYAKAFGEKNDVVVPTVTTPAGEISETLYSGTLGSYYDKQSD